MDIIEDNTYLVELTNELTAEIEQEVADKGIEITYKSDIINDFIVIKTLLPIEELQLFHLFKTVKPSRVGRLYI